MADLKERLDNLRTHIQEPEFLAGKGLSNEVNIRIFCYDAVNEMIVRQFIDGIITDQTITCHIVECNLYEIFLTLCDDIGITDAIPEMEKEDGKNFLLEQLHSAISEGDFIDKIQYDPHKPDDVLMLTGVGDVFPFMRVHSLLEALQPHFSDIPILVMYPGTFDGSYVRLFDKLKPNAYYRAFNEI